MTNISVVIATLNEEENISRCLESIVNLAKEIIIVDAKSTDRTVKIAQRFKAKIYSINNNRMFHKNKQLGLEKATYDWILQLDADEVITKELETEIKELVDNNKFDGYYIPRKNFFLGRFMKKGGLYPDYVIRLIRKKKAYFPCKSVHEQIKVDGGVGHLFGHILHYSDPDLTRYLKRSNRYTTLTAHELYQKNVRINIVNTLKYCIFLPLKTFISIYIRHKGFLDGFPGFVWALLSSTHYFLAYAKLLNKYKN